MAGVCDQIDILCLIGHVQQQPHLPTKHHPGGSVTCSLLLRRPVCHQGKQQPQVPILLVGTAILGQLFRQRPVKALHHAVALRVKRGGARLVDPQQLTALPEPLRLELPPLVRMQLTWNTKSREKHSYQYSSHSFCLVIWDPLCLWPFGEVIHGHQDVAVISGRTRQ